jgi:hypothetical protein
MADVQVLTHITENLGPKVFTLGRMPFSLQDVSGGRSSSQPWNLGSISWSDHDLDLTFDHLYFQLLEPGPPSIPRTDLSSSYLLGDVLVCQAGCPRPTRYTYLPVEAAFAHPLRVKLYLGTYGNWAFSCASTEYGMMSGVRGEWPGLPPDILMQCVQACLGPLRDAAARRSLVRWAA